jgi:hypothetical protein
MMRVAVVCCDSSKLARVVAHLRSLGVSPYACPTLSELDGFAERADVVLAFADGLDVVSLVRQLEALERWTSGPALIVLTDQKLPWTPTVTRERPAIRAPVAFLEWPVVDPEPSAPELPFTD